MQCVVEWILPSFCKPAAASNSQLTYAHVAPRAEKFEAARKWGATDCVNPKDYDKPIQQVRAAWHHSLLLKKDLWCLPVRAAVPQAQRQCQSGRQAYQPATCSVPASHMQRVLLWCAAVG